MRGVRNLPPPDALSPSLPPLLSSVHPFDQERNREVLFRRIVHGDFSMTRSEIARVSKEAKELIQDLLELDPSYRMSGTGRSSAPLCSRDRVPCVASCSL